VRLGRGGVDGDDPGVRQRAAQDGQVQHARQLHVVAVPAEAAHEARVLLAQHPAVAERLAVVDVAGAVDRGRAVLGGGHEAVSCRCAAAQWIERTIVA
jgi:hypothetical protein